MAYGFGTDTSTLPWRAMTCQAEQAGAKYGITPAVYATPDAGRAHTKVTPYWITDKVLYSHDASMDLLQWFEQNRQHSQWCRQLDAPALSMLVLRPQTPPNDAPCNLVEVGLSFPCCLVAVSELRAASGTCTSIHLGQAKSFHVPAYQPHPAKVKPAGCRTRVMQHLLVCIPVTAAAWRVPPAATALAVARAADNSIGLQPRNKNNTGGETCSSCACGIPSQCAYGSPCKRPLVSCQSVLKSYCHPCNNA
jgi:hypothetical protein